MIDENPVCSPKLRTCIVAAYLLFAGGLFAAGFVLNFYGKSGGWYSVTIGISLCVWTSVVATSEEIAAAHAVQLVRVFGEYAKKKDEGP